MSSNSSEIEITAQCLCKAQVFKSSTSRASLPLKASCCHCNSCRHNTGALYSSDAPWPGPIERILESSLSRYQFSGNVDVLFCAKCSATMFFHEHFAGQPESVGVFTGALLNHDIPNLITFGDHIFVGDTQDGGATPWLSTNTDGTQVRLWKGARNKSEELSRPWPPVSELLEAVEKTGTKSYPIRCHCKGVDLVLRRRETHAGTDKSSLPWFIDPRNLKHNASFDVCDPCRNSFGIDIIHWTFAFIAQLDFVNSHEKTNQDQAGFPHSSITLKEAVSGSDRDSRFGTLAMYPSSPDVQRYFCSRCSASVFYAVDDRPEMINVAIGLLEAPEGARAEGLLSWGFGSAIGNIEDLKGGWREEYAKLAQEKAEAWRIERGYPKSFRRLLQENPQKSL